MQGTSGITDPVVESHHQAPRTPTNGVTVHARLMRHVYENAGANGPNVFNQFGVFALQSFACPSNPPSAPESSSTNSLPLRVPSPLDEDHMWSVRGLDTAVLTSCMSADTQSNKKQHQANVDLGPSSEAGESDRETPLAPQSEASLDFLSRARNDVLFTGRVLESDRETQLAPQSEASLAFLSREQNDVLFTGRVLPRIPTLRVPPNSPARLRPNLRTLFG
jgi:hypothetical protein